jgi:hypothetical protein
MPPVLRHSSVELLSSFGIRHSDHDGITISDDSVHRRRNRFVGRPRGCNLSDCAGAYRRDPKLRRIAGLFSGIGQFVCQDRRHSSGNPRRTGIFQRVQLRHVCRIWPRVGAEIPCSNCRCHVHGHAVAAVCTGVSATCVLPLLLVLSGDYVSHCRATDRCAAWSRQVCLIARPGVALLISCSRSCSLQSLLEHEHEYE